MQPDLVHARKGMLEHERLHSSIPHPAPVVVIEKGKTYGHGVLLIGRCVVARAANNAGVGFIDRRAVYSDQTAARIEERGEIIFKDFALPAIVFGMAGPSGGRRRREVKPLEVGFR